MIQEETDNSPIARPAWPVPAVLVLLFAVCQLRLLMVTRRQMLKLSGMAAGSALLPASGQQPALADYTIRIAPIRLEIAPGRTVKTTAFNGRIPGELIRLQEGKTVAIDVINDTDVPDIVHWHGLQIPASEDGASEE